MKLTLQRYHDTGEETLGLLFIDGVFACHTLEDQYQAKKVYAETRIPAGKYLLGLRSYGTLYEKYGHPMIEIRNVPNFTGILIHRGNTDKDTAGCILLGDGISRNVNGRMSITDSGIAYDRVYPLIAPAVASTTTIEIFDELTLIMSGDKFSQPISLA